MTQAEVAAELLAEQAGVAYADGNLEGAIAAWEQLHAVHLAAGDTLGAAEAAAMVATHLLIDTGLMAPVRGWVGRSERLLEEHGEIALSATLSAVRGYERFMCGDLASAQTEADRAFAQAEKYGNADASVIAQTCQMRLTFLSGCLDEGLARLDAVGARLMAGEASPLVTGMMLCEVVCAAQGLAMHDVAREWTDAMDAWRADSAFGGLHGRCRVHRAELLRISGPLDRAESEALAACAELHPWMRREYGWPLVELGTIRLRRGDLDGAEQVFIEAQQHAWCPQPGLALVHLARGEVDIAAEMVAHAIAHPMANPSKEQPPFGDLRLAPLLHAQAEIAAAALDPLAAARAAERLGRISSVYPSRALMAMADATRARAAVLIGEPDRALAFAGAALVAWAELGASYDAAVARSICADAHAAAGRQGPARAERAIARQAFADVGASAKVAELDLLIGESSKSRSHGGSPELGEFRCVDGLRTVRFGGVEVLVADLKGFRYVEELLREPGREFHVVDLAARNRDQGDETIVQSGIVILDDEARLSYRRRLVEVDEDLDEARALNDLARVELAERDREYLVAELAGAIGLGGRGRTTGGSAERARTSVTRAVRYALQRLAESHPLAAGHLEHSVKTGTFCSYTPDPAIEVRWN